MRQAASPPPAVSSGAPRSAGLNLGGLPSAATVLRPPTPPAPHPAGGGPPPPVLMPGTSPSPGTTQRVCAACGGTTPPGYAFCQHCGAKLGPPSGGTPAGGTPWNSPSPVVLDAIAATLVPAKAGDIPLPPRPPPATGAHVPSSQASAPVQAPGPPESQDDAFAPTMAPMGADELASAMAAQGLAAPARPGWVSHTPAKKTPATPYARLISVTRDGRDGEAFALTSEQVHVGRIDGDLLFAADLFLAPRHAWLEKRGPAVVVHPIDTINGVYLKTTEPLILADGDQFLCGRELFRFETIEPAERDVMPGVQHGVHLLGSPPRVPWGRLRQLIISGATRDVIYLNRPEIVLGREEGDFRFADDEFMSRRHLSLTLQGGRPQLLDLGSSNGTYVRLRGERALRPGELMRMGDQLLRFEPV